MVEGSIVASLSAIGTSIVEDFTVTGSTAIATLAEASTVALSEAYLIGIGAVSTVIVT